jgi:hypothetical protein
LARWKSVYYIENHACDRSLISFRLSELKLTVPCLRQMLVELHDLK